MDRVLQKLVVIQLVKNPQVHDRVHQSPLLVRVMSQMHSSHTFPPYFPKMHSNIVLPTMPRYSEWSFHSHYQTKLCMHFLQNVQLNSSIFNFLQDTRLEHITLQLCPDCMIRTELPGVVQASGQ